MKVKKMIIFFILGLSIFSCQFNDEKKDESSFVVNHDSEKKLVTAAIQKDFSPIIDASKKINQVWSLITEHMNKGIIVDGPTREFIRSGGITSVFEGVMDIGMGYFRIDSNGAFIISYPMSFVINRINSNRSMPISFDIEVSGQMVSSELLYYHLTFKYLGSQYNILRKSQGAYTFDLQRFLEFISKVLTNQERPGEVIENNFADLNLTLELYPLEKKVTLRKMEENKPSLIKIFNGSAQLDIQKLNVSFKIGQNDINGGINQIQIEIAPTSPNGHSFIQADLEALWLIYTNGANHGEVKIPWSEIF